MRAYLTIILFCIALFLGTTEAGRIKLFDKHPRAVHDFAGVDAEPNFRRIRGRVCQTRRLQYTS